MGDLPLYDLTIDFEDETGVEFISLVDNPAIQIDWQSFSKNIKQEFKVLNEDKKIIAGFAMVADMPIYRRDESGEYNVRFTAETITKIIEKFFKNSKTDVANIMHTDLMAQDTFVIESFQINSDRGILTPKGFEEQANGSWFVSMKVNNDEVWNQVKQGEFKGFSIEGVFEHKRINNEHMNKEEKTFFESVKELFTNSKVEAEVEVAEVVTEAEVEVVEEVSMGEAPLADGTLIKWEGELEVGTMIKVVTEEGDVQAEDRDYELADGSLIIRTEGGMVAELIEAETVEEVEEEMEDLFKEEMAQKFNAITEKLDNLTKTLETKEKDFNEFKEQTKKDLDAKDKTIQELSEMEVAEPTQKTAIRPNWAFNKKKK